MRESTALLAGPAGITCLSCGAVLPSGAAPAKGHAPRCPTAARWVAESVLGGTPASLAAGLAREAMAAGGVEAVRAVAVALRDCAVILDDHRAPGPLRVYLAGGASERLTVCRPMVQRLQAAGVEVTHDWTSDPGWDDPAPMVEAIVAAALADLDGVRRCDVLWLLCPEAKSEGSAAELGAALAWGKRVVVSGPWDGLGRIFPGLASRRAATHEEGMVEVMAAGRVLLAGRREGA